MSQFCSVSMCFDSVFFVDLVSQSFCLSFYSSVALSFNYSVPSYLYSLFSSVLCLVSSVLWSLLACFVWILLKTTLELYLLHRPHLYNQL